MPRWYARHASDPTLEPICDVVKVTGDFDWWLCYVWWVFLDKKYTKNIKEKISTIEETTTTTPNGVWWDLYEKIKNEQKYTLSKTSYEDDKN